MIFNGIGTASECSLFDSSEYASVKSSVSVYLPHGITSVTFGSPLVSVPVL